MEFHNCCMIYGSCDCDPRDMEIATLRAENQRLRRELRDSLAQHDWVASHFDIHWAHAEIAKEALK